MQHDTDRQLHDDEDLESELMSALTYLGYVANSVSLNLTALLIRFARNGVLMEHRLLEWKSKYQKRV